MLESHPDEATYIFSTPFLINSLSSGQVHRSPGPGSGTGEHET